MTDEPWLKPQEETEQQKAERKRRARENPPTARHVIRQLDDLQSKPKPQAPPEKPPAPLRRQQRIDPKAIIEGEEPQPIAEHTASPRVIGEPVQPAPPAAPPAAPAAAARPAPDPRLVEIAQTWSWLSERDREELLLLVRIKAHLNQQAADK